MPGVAVKLVWKRAVVTAPNPATAAAPSTSTANVNFLPVERPPNTLSAACFTIASLSNTRLMRPRMPNLCRALPGPGSDLKCS